MHKLKMNFAGICAKYFALRKAQSNEVGGFIGKSGGENRCDKCCANTSGTHVDIVHGTSGAIGRSIPAYDGYSSGGVRYCLVSSR